MSEYMSESIYLSIYILYILRSLICKNGKHIFFVFLHIFGHVFAHTFAHTFAHIFAHIFAHLWCHIWSDIWYHIWHHKPQHPPTMEAAFGRLHNSGGPPSAAPHCCGFHSGGCWGLWCHIWYHISYQIWHHKWYQIMQNSKTLMFCWVGGCSPDIATRSVYLEYV